MSDNHIVQDSDLYFTIDPVTRTITNKSGKTKLMQYDHNSEMCTFEIPRCIEGHDMSLCDSIQIHYLNTGSGTSASVRGVNVGIYEATDAQTTKDDKLVFTWLISQNATVYAGTLKFQIKFECYSTNEHYPDGYVWNTDTYSAFEVAAGIDNSNAVFEEYVDLLNQWKAEIDEDLKSKADSDGSSNNQKIPLLCYMPVDEYTKSGVPYIKLDSVDGLVVGDNLIKAKYEDGVFTGWQSREIESIDIANKVIKLGSKFSYQPGYYGKYEAKIKNGIVFAENLLDQTHAPLGTTVVIFEADDPTYMHVEGYNNVGVRYSTVEGFNNVAASFNSHVEGSGNIASGHESHAEGEGCVASGKRSHAEGTNTEASGVVSHAEGSGTKASGAQSHAEGYKNEASGDASHAEGRETEASGFGTHSEGYLTKATNNTAHAEGHGSVASGQSAHAEGRETNASGDRSHAEGELTLASGMHSHAEGCATKATNNAAHAEGFQTEASGVHSHAEGYLSKASSNGAHAEGTNTEASGDASHAEGRNTQARAMRSHAEGEGTIAAGSWQHVQGKYNLVDKDYYAGSGSKYAFIVGNGSGEDEYNEAGVLVKQNRSNAFTLDWDGNAWFAGGVSTTLDGKTYRMADIIRALKGAGLMS